MSYVEDFYTITYFGKNQPFWGWDWIFFPNQEFTSKELNMEYESKEILKFHYVVCKILSENYFPKSIT